MGAAQLRLRRYDGPARLDDAALALAVSPVDSKLFVTGSSHQSTSDIDYATIAYHAG